MLTPKVQQAALAVLVVGVVAACSPRATSAQDTPTPQKKTTASGGPCDAAAKGLEACAGKVTRVKGKRSVAVSQHPMMAGPSMDGQPEVKQDYLDAHGSQLVILYTKPLPSCAAYVLEGKLSRIDLGGSTGKGSYKGWSLRVDKATCAN